MVNEWYYTQDNVKNGPCSAQELKELAAGGIILPLDIISREGSANGSLAKNVGGLFPVVAVPFSAAEPEALMHEPPDDLLASEETEEEEVKEPEVVAAVPKPTWQPPPPKKGRALAIKGAIITGQDGTTVFFRKKCVKCGYEDQGRLHLLIRNGMMRTNFFCPKCRKSKPVEIQGTST